MERVFGTMGIAVLIPAVDDAWTARSPQLSTRAQISCFFFFSFSLSPWATDARD
jgi:hypothetical protein